MRWSLHLGLSYLLERPFVGALALILGLSLGGAALADQPSSMPAEPPSVTRDPALTARLAEAYAAKGPDYVPRTHLVQDGRAKYVNRLILEASPYLIQHAHNPVDWRPWGEDALAEAAATGKAIFLSVGYATCHWCHVMEEESFDDEEVAALLNRHFIAIKIDREQRPDLDHIYITATQIQQGHAGWPNSLFLRPDGVPFHTGTYFPRHAFMNLLSAVAGAWDDPARKPEIDRVAQQLSAAIQRQQAARMAASPPPGPESFAAAVTQLAEMHNDLEGGFSNSQQFPQEGFLLFLLDQWRRTGDGVALQIATRTLDAIAAGGIHDHLGGGFHRYTVDPNWRTPHFEKMLYNQGQLARVFIEGWEATGSDAYRRAAERVFAYVARDMTDPEGAFYAAEDADSRDATGELEEGAFYVMSPGEARHVLAEEGDHAVSVLGLDQHPTIEAGPVVHLDPAEQVVFERLDPLLETLRLHRDRRVRPLRDEKVIAGWNGLMIRALAEGSVAFEAPAYADQAARAGEVLWSRLWQDGRLSRLWAGGAALEAGALEDYAWLGLGFLALDEAGAGPVWRERALALADAMVAKFGDGAGRLKMAAADGPLGPVYDSSDGAVPAGESSALEFLVRVAGLTQRADLRIRAEELRAAISAAMVEIPLLRTEAVIGSRVLDQ
ncbi:MAG: thioredoxin domain-containing protein, partial [Pseudomonadota bacterium]